MITDFGIPKVVGGNFNVLATDVFKLVIGQQDFQRGAVVALAAADAGGADLRDRPPRAAQADLGPRRRARSRCSPSRNRRFDAAMTLYCVLIVGASCSRCSAWRCSPRFANLWPYNLTPSLVHYVSGPGRRRLARRYFNSAEARGRPPRCSARAIGLRRRLPGREDARPGLLRAPLNPAGQAAAGGAGAGARRGLHLLLQFARATRWAACTAGMALLVLCTVAHFFSVGAPHDR